MLYFWSNNRRIG